MRQHPVPQNITGFEFKLIGFLTLRQFGYLAVAGVLDFILFSAKPPLLVILVFAGPISTLALALAFFRINDLPFEISLAAFLKLVTSPNVRVWHREPKVLGFLEPQFSIYLQHQQGQDEPKVVSDRSKLNNYLATTKNPRTKLMADMIEQRRLAQLHFTTLESEPQVFIPPQIDEAGSSEAKVVLPKLQRMVDIIQKSTVQEGV